MKAYIAIPTFNGGDVWKQAARNIKKYSPNGTLVQVIDSGSKDETVEVAINNGFKVFSINPADFNHGGTRNLAVDMHKNEYDIVIFLTQDAIPEPGFMEELLNVFKDTSISCAYGRQLPHEDSNPISEHARYFNYSGQSYIASLDSISTMGIKAAFTSNSFSAYRISRFLESGGFPNNTILSEDMFYAAKAILSGDKVAYVADSQVRHSHNYKTLDEFRRYFDIGVFHADESWIRRDFGGAGGEGKRFLISEFFYLMKNGPMSIPASLIHNIAKIVGYKLGQNYKSIPNKMIRLCSMHKRYWDKVERNNKDNGS